MTGPKGNSEFCFPSNLSVLQGKANQNILVKENRTHCFQQMQSLSVLLYLRTQKIEDNCKKIIA